jgi:glycosyltransferase involved in cell wall biosynthesis
VFFFAFAASARPMRRRTIFNGSAAMDTGKINFYVSRELQKEIGELERRVAVLERGFTPTVSRRFGELKQTVARLATARPRPAPMRFHADRTRGAGESEAPALVCAAAPGERLLIDVTNTISCSFISGIQRVVRELASAASAAGAGVPVVVENGVLNAYSMRTGRRQKIEVAPGDKFVMADASWNDLSACRKAMDEVSLRGGSNIVVLHDIHPLLYPGLFHPANVEAFGKWFDEALADSDALVAVSRSSLEEFLEYALINGKRVNPNMRIGWRHLGSDVGAGDDDRRAPQVAAICAGGAPFFLSVGTLEPKKGYSIALDAFERAWAQGVEARYVIVGRSGWNTRALQHRIETHAEHGKRLFWLGQVGAGDLVQLYEHAHRLVAASVAEGFGLPLVEAAHFGLPTIASDIPVFREVGGDAVVYFDVADSESLATRIREACARRRMPAALPRRRSWREATDDLIDLVRSNDYQFGALAWRLAGATALEPERAPPRTILRAVT